MKRRAVAAGALVALILATAGAVLVRGRHRGVPNGATSVARAADLPADAHAPSGVRIRVEVLNATKTRGLARRATLFLRDLGYDVVDMGTSGASAGDSTVVIDRSGHPDWARRIALAFGAARTITRTDTSRYLDVTVLVGPTWRPPAEPFYP